MDAEILKRKRDPQAIRLISQPTIGTVPVDNRWGGNKPLHVMRLPNKANLCLMPWSMPPQALQLIQKAKGRVMVVVTLDLNAEGMPAMSVAIQPFTHVEQQSAVDLVQRLNRAAAIQERKRLIKPGE